MKPSGIKLLTNFAGEDLVTEILGSVTMKTVVFGRAELQPRGVCTWTFRGERSFTSCCAADVGLVLVALLPS
jgi:hypothetical protein